MIYLVLNVLKQDYWSSQAQNKNAPLDKNYKTYAELAEATQFNKPQAPLTPKLEDIIQAPTQPIDIPPPGKW